MHYIWRLHKDSKKLCGLQRVWPLLRSLHCSESFCLYPFPWLDCKPLESRNRESLIFMTESLARGFAQSNACCWIEAQIQAPRAGWGTLKPTGPTVLKCWRAWHVCRGAERAGVWAHGSSCRPGHAGTCLPNSPWAKGLALTWDTGNFKVRLQILGPRWHLELPYSLTSTSFRERRLCLALGKVEPVCAPEQAPWSCGFQPLICPEAKPIVPKKQWKEVHPRDPPQDTCQQLRSTCDSHWWAPALSTPPSGLHPSGLSASGAPRHLSGWMWQPRVPLPLSTTLSVLCLGTEPGKGIHWAQLTWQPLVTSLPSQSLLSSTWGHCSLPPEGRRAGKEGQKQKGVGERLPNNLPRFRHHLQNKVQILFWYAELFPGWARPQLQPYLCLSRLWPDNHRSYVRHLQLLSLEWPFSSLPMKPYPLFKASFCSRCLLHHPGKDSPTMPQWQLLPYHRLSGNTAGSLTHSLTHYSIHSFTQQAFIEYVYESSSVLVSKCTTGNKIEFLPLWILQLLRI